MAEEPREVLENVAYDANGHLRKTGPRDVPNAFDVIRMAVAPAHLARWITLFMSFALFVYAMRADGLIVATPTGSTAYALAAGGPILPPELKNILLVAVAPHLIIDRPVVLHEGTTVDLRVVTDHRAVLSADGRGSIALSKGDLVRVQSSPHVCRFVRVQPKSYFYRTLMARMAQNPAAELETNPNQ